MLNQKLSQKLLQKLSPQQIQLIKLLQVPSVQMEQRIKQEIEENPALEELPKLRRPHSELVHDDDAGTPSFTLLDDAILVPVAIFIFLAFDFKCFRISNEFVIIKFIKK